MKKSTIYQNRLACKKAVELYLNGNIADARQAAKRVSWAFMYNWLCENWEQTGSKDEADLTNAIKGIVEI